MPDARALRRRAAIEAIEQVRQVGRRDARPVIANRDRQPVVRRPARRRRSASPPASTARRSRAGAPARPRSAADRAAPARPARCARRPGAAAARARPGRAPRRRSPTDASTATSVATAPASMRAISRMFWNSRVRRSTSARIRSLCSDAARPASATAPGGCSRRRGSPSAACAGRGRATPAAPSSAPRSAASSSPALRSSRNCARSIAIATTPAERVERAGFDRTPGRRQQPDRLGADAQRHQSNAAAVDRRSCDGRRRCARRRRTRATVCADGERRATARRVSRAQSSTRRLRRRPSRRPRGSAIGHELEVEPARDRPRQHRDAPRGCR